MIFILILLIACVGFYSAFMAEEELRGYVLLFFTILFLMFRMIVVAGLTRNKDIAETDIHFAYDAELKSSEVVPANNCHNKNNKKYCEIMKKDVKESDSEELVKVVVEDYELK